MPIDDVPHTEVTCFVYHEGGGYIQSSLIVADYSAKSGQSRDQQRGSSLTYAQRYLLAMIYGIAPGGDQGEPDKEIELQQKATVKPTKRISPTQSEKPVEADSNLIVPSFKDSLVVRIAPMEEAERNELMLEFKKQFSIRCNETRSNPKGIPSREHITLQEHGDWFDIKLRERAERLKQEIKEQ
jgi:hypothetical protein